MLPKIPGILASVRGPVLLAGILSVLLLEGCFSPDGWEGDGGPPIPRTLPPDVGGIPPSRFRCAGAPDAGPELPESPVSDDYVAYALFHSPLVESAYQRWRAAAERLPQAGALPDPQLGGGVFLRRMNDERARVGVSQTFPWPGKLADREDAASRAAYAAWRRYEFARLAVAERVLSALYELAYLDAAVGIAREDLELLKAFEEVVRIRYRVGAGSHPELVRVQVALGRAEDRIAQLEATRPALAAELNAAMAREPGWPVGPVRGLPDGVAAGSADDLARIAGSSNPLLLALDEQVEEQRHLVAAARKDGYPDFTLGVEYMFVKEGMEGGGPGMGDDPVMLKFGMRLPLGRARYEAAEREAVARSRAVAHERADETNRVAAAIKRTWFEHTDADRRFRLFKETLIPKAEESLAASLAGFRTGDATFLSLLDTERTLIEFAIAAERARADRGKALAKLQTLAGSPVPVAAPGRGDDAEK